MILKVSHEVEKAVVLFGVIRQPRFDIVKVAQGIGHCHRPSITPITCTYGATVASKRSAGR